MYTIGQVSEMFHLPVSTLRYYDKEGLFPNLKRESGIRKFNDHELEALRMIECLKASGLKSKTSNNSSNGATRKQHLPEPQRTLRDKKKAVEQEILRLNKTLDMLKYKCWYYDQAMKEGNEDKIRQMLPDNLPKDIQQLYDNGHK